MRTATLSKFKSGSTRAGLIITLAASAALVAVFIYFRAERNRANDRLNQLALQNETLKTALDDAKKQLDEMSSGDSSAAAKKASNESRTAASPQPVQETETLFLQDPAVEQTSEGLLVHLKYLPGSGVEFPDSTMIVFRVPNNGTTDIISLNAVGSEARAIINPDKTLAMIECSPSEIGSLEFEFKVSGPTTATVRGSEGILDFKMDITPTGCRVSSL